MIDFSSFLERYYKKAILDFAFNPDCSTFILDYQDLERFDIEHAEELINNPDFCFATIMRELKDRLEIIQDDYDDIDNLNIQDIRISIKGIPETPIYKIGSKHTSKLICIECRINNQGPLKHKLEIAAFKCQRCGKINIIQQPDNDTYIEPYECENDVCNRRGPFKLIPEESERVDLRYLEVQDLYENVKPGQPIREIKIKVTGQELNNNLPAIGSHALITGIVREVQQSKSSSLYDPVIEAVHIETKEADTDISLSNREEQEFHELVRTNDIYDVLINASAKRVKGHRTIKEGLLCSVVSGPNIELEDSVWRGYCHTALIGDPATGKTVLTLSLSKLIPRSQYAAGKGASGPGLTVSTVKDDLSGKWVGQPGALVLADKGLLVIDELDKLKQEEIQALNTALENSKFPLNKAGINQEFNCRCPVIALSNPKLIRFDGYGTFEKQINIPSDTLSRFDLVFLIKDKPDIEQDRKIADHQGRLLQQAEGKKEPGKEILSFEKLQKFIAYAKSFNPAISDEVRDGITAYFSEELRQNNDGTFQATNRSINTLYRLVKSIAKLRLSDKCEMQDLERAKQIYAESLETFRDPTTGKIDIDIQAGYGKAQRDKLKRIIDIIRDLQNSNGKTAFIDDIISISTYPKNQVYDILHHLKEQGDIIEVKEDRYRLF